MILRDRCRDRVHFGLCFVERETGGDARAGAQKSPVARLAFAVARRRGGVVGSLDDTSRRWIRRYGGSTERPSDGPLFSRARDRSNRRPEKLVAQNRDPSLGRDFLGCERGNAVLEPIPDIVGRDVRFKNASWQILGVMPQSFRTPGTLRGEVQLFKPWDLESEYSTKPNQGRHPRFSSHRELFSIGTGIFLAFENRDEASRARDKEAAAEQRRR